ncbi:MAG: NusG domain II-containing protein [Bacillota bacterium]
MKFKKGDILIVLLVAVVGSAWYIYSMLSNTAESGQIVIQVDNEIVRKMLLSDIKASEELHIDLGKGRHMDIVMDKDGVYVEEVICPDEVCKKTGKITRVGQSIVCLPNRVVIFIEGKKDTDTDIDGISY